jgi:hypothetical protein
MALGNNSSAIYLKISNGKVVRSFKTPTANSVTRTTDNGKIVHEETYGFIEGIITDISTKENDYGKFWVVKITDEGTDYILEFNYSGGIASSFLKTLPNVNFARPVRISPKQTIDGDKKKNTLFINQDGQPLKWFWTKDNPGDLPPLEKIKIKGKESWDDSRQLDFLEMQVKVLLALNAKAVTSDIPQEDF